MCVCVCVCVCGGVEGWGARADPRVPHLVGNNTTRVRLTGGHCLRPSQPDSADFREPNSSRRRAVRVREAFDPINTLISGWKVSF